MFMNQTQSIKNGRPAGIPNATVAPNEKFAVASIDLQLRTENFDPFPHTKTALIDPGFRAD